MKHIFISINVLIFNSFVSGQITMQTNLPATLGLNTELTFEVKIKKGANTNFSKYQMDVPQGVGVKEVDSKTGSFTFEENRVKIIWVITPTSPEFGVTMKLMSGSVPGTKTFVQKYFYMENDDKKEVEMESIMVEFKDSASGSVVTSDAPFITLNTKLPAALYTATINPSEMNTKNPEALKQQVFQLKKDSRDANTVGEREKAKAELKLKEANEAISMAETLTNEEEKKATLEKANADKQQAEKDLEVAEKVLTLAKTLDKNADEIEGINKSINPGSYNNQTTVVTSNNSAPATNLEKVPEPKESDSAKDIEKLKEAFKSPDNSGSNNTAANKTPAANNTAAANNTRAAKESGLVFKVQVGAFGKEPARSDFRSLGKVAIVTDNGMFKVLVGSFSSKEEALKKREEVITKGFDGFVVSYQDGVRVK